MKNKIVTICLILLVVTCIGITQLPGIYAKPTDYSDFNGIVISKDDSYHEELAKTYCFTFRTEDDSLTYPYSSTLTSSWASSTFIAETTTENSIGYLNCNCYINDYNNPYPDIPLPPKEKAYDEYFREYYDLPYKNTDIFDYVFKISNYWKIYTTDNTYYGIPFFYLKPYNYIEPEYNIECTPKEVTPGETSKCELKVNYHSKIRSLNFKLDTDQYNISNVEAGEDFEDLQINDGVYSLLSKSTLEDSEEGRTTTILSFTIKSVGNAVASADNIKVLDLEYEDELSESPKKTYQQQ